MEIRLRGVSKAYQGLSLGPLDLAVPSGTLAVLEGGNGSGKTTLLEIVAGTVVPDAGRVLLGGRDVAGVPPFDRGVFYIPQTLHKFWALPHASRHCFIPGLSVGENLRAAAGSLGPGAAREWRTRLGLDAHARARPESLSFGLQQRLALARAVLARPGIILIDEGLSSLDPAARAEAFALVREVPRLTGNTVVYVTHHPQDAAGLGGARWRMERGSLRSGRARPVDAAPPPAPDPAPAAAPRAAPRPRLRAFLAARAPAGCRAESAALAALKAHAESLPDLRRRVEVEARTFTAEVSPEVMLQEAARAAPDVVGLSCQLWSAGAMLALAERVRAALPGAVIVLGGPEVSPDSEELRRGVSADHLVWGEGEAAFAGLLEKLLDGGDPASVPGVARVRDGRGTLGSRARPLADLDAAYPEGEGSMAALGGRPTEAVVEVSRDGDGPPRRRSAARVVADVERLRDAGEIEVVHLCGAGFLDDRAYARELFGGLARAARGSRLELRWEADPRRLDGEPARLLDFDGLVLVHALDEAGAVPEDLSASLRELRRLAPRARTSLRALLGLPGDDLASFLARLDWAHRTATADCGVLSVLASPGSRWRGLALRRGLVHEARPPYRVLATPEFPEADLREAAATAELVRALMTARASRAALDRAARRGGEDWSVVRACRALAARLSGGAARVLADRRRALAASDSGAALGWPAGGSPGPSGRGKGAPRAETGRLRTSLWYPPTAG